jgi:hypothetical protein
MLNTKRKLSANVKNNDLHPPSSILHPAVDYDYEDTFEIADDLDQNITYLILRSNELGRCFTV